MDLSTAAVAAASEVPPDLVEVDGASISMVVCFKVMDLFTVALLQIDLGD